MSLGGMRAAQGIREQAARSVRDAATSSPANSKWVRRFATAAVDSSSSAADSRAVVAAGDDKRKRAEEALRMVMYLSCWGPN